LGGRSNVEENQVGAVQDGLETVLVYPGHLGGVKRRQGQDREKKKEAAKTNKSHGISFQGTLG
jgi:hypothetical protein